MNLYQFDEHVEVITIDELLVERFNREAKDFNSLIIDISLNKEWIYPLLAAYPCEQQIDISNNSNLSIRIGKVDVHFKGSLSHQLGEWSIYSLDANSLKITTSITKNYYLVHSDQAKFWGLIDSFDVLYRIHPIAFLAVKEAGLILEKIIFKSSSRLPKHIFDIGEARPEVVFGNQIFENENLQAIQHSSEKVYLYSKPLKRGMIIGSRQAQNFLGVFDFGIFKKAIAEGLPIHMVIEAFQKTKTCVENNFSNGFIEKPVNLKDPTLMYVLQGGRILAYHDKLELTIINDDKSTQLASLYLIIEDDRKIVCLSVNSDFALALETFVFNSNECIALQLDNAGETNGNLSKEQLKFLEKHNIVFVDLVERPILPSIHSETKFTLNPVEIIAFQHGIVVGYYAWQKFVVEVKGIEYTLLDGKSFNPYSSDIEKERWMFISRQKDQSTYTLLDGDRITPLNFLLTLDESIRGEVKSELQVKYPNVFASAYGQLIDTESKNSKPAIGISIPNTYGFDIYIDGCFKGEQKSLIGNIKIFQVNKTRNNIIICDNKGVCGEIHSIKNGDIKLLDENLVFNCVL